MSEFYRNGIRYFCPYGFAAGWSGKHPCYPAPPVTIGQAIKALRKARTGPPLAMLYARWQGAVRRGNPEEIARRHQEYLSALQGELSQSGAAAAIRSAIPSIDSGPPPGGPPLQPPTPQAICTSANCYVWPPGTTSSGQNPLTNFPFSNVRILQGTVVDVLETGSMQYVTPSMFGSPTTLQVPAYLVSYQPPSGMAIVGWVDQGQLRLL